MKYYGSDEDLTVPAELGGLPVSMIADGAFSWNNDLVNVTFSEGIVSMGAEIFAYSTFLESVTFPASLAEIGFNPFIGCDSLEAISVSADHPLLEVRDNVLFNKQEHALISYPPL